MDVIKQLKKVIKDLRAEAKFVLKEEADDDLAVNFNNGVLYTLNQIEFELNLSELTKKVKEDRIAHDASIRAATKKSIIKEIKNCKKSAVYNDYYIDNDINIGEEYDWVLEHIEELD